MSSDVQPVGLSTTPQTIVTATLERVGWEIRSAEIDLVRGEVILIAHRFDGRWLYLRGTNDGGVVERFQRSEINERRSRGLLIDVIVDEFLGRDRCEGPRSGLRHVCNYIADNPSPGFPALSSGVIKNAIRLLLR